MNKVIERLMELYPEPVCELNFSTPFELLVAVILSAQCTDKRVNQVTKTLFKEFNSPQDFAQIDQSLLESKIYSCGFYRNKAKNIISSSRDIIVKHNGVLPSTLEELVKLAGVGKKTASVVLSVAFDVPAIAVDTHVFRLSKRLGLADEKTPEKTQDALEKVFPKKLWSKGHYALVLHGRYVCKSQNPQCEMCGLRDLCKYYKEKR
jgi:endonuclease-3